MLSQHALQVVSPHALQQVSGGVPGPGQGAWSREVPGPGVVPGPGGLVWGVPGPGGGLVRGVSGPRGCLLGGSALRRGCGDLPPESRRLLLRTVRILLECILVSIKR